MSDDGTAVVEVAEELHLSHRRILIIIGGLLIGMLLAALDQTIVATALPTIAGELHGLSHLSWVVTAYLLASTASTPLWGKLGDLYGRKTFFQAAIVIFLIGSVLAGLSQSMLQLILFRAVQGIGGGGLMVGAQTIVADIVSPRERGRYQGMVRGHLRDHQRARAAHRWLLCRPRLVALGVLRQPPGRRGRPRRRHGGPARSPAAHQAQD